MARILGAVASSHTPTIGFALDKHKQDDPVWAPIFADYKPVQDWLAQKKPDVLRMIFKLEKLGAVAGDSPTASWDKK